MNWRYKALLQAFLSHLPAGHSLNYLFRRYVTRTVPASSSVQTTGYSFAAEYVSTFATYGAVPLEKAVFYELGVGWDLMIPFSLYSLGINHQIVTDLRRLIRSELVAHTIATFPALKLEPAPIRLPRLCLSRAHGRELDGHLREHYGIDYRAPFDARTTGFPSGSVDYLTATMVLSYIPVTVLRDILRECHRVLRPGGMMSVLMDYRDEYSYFDSKISVYNLLRYSDKVWELLYNPPLNYQNRLRHSDFKNLFIGAGFEVERDEPGYDRTIEEARALLASVPLAKRFRTYDPDDLAAVRGVFVLRKSSGHRQKVMAGRSETYESC
jgi:SAM-dependent methyltransferase